jgi:hypothetical protein
MDQLHLKNYNLYHNTESVLNEKHSQYKNIKIIKQKL